MKIELQYLHVTCISTLTTNCKESKIDTMHKAVMKHLLHHWTLDNVWESGWPYPQYLRALIVTDHDFG